MKVKAYYEKTVFLYVQGYLEFKENDIEMGKEKMQQAIKVFKILDEKAMLQYYTDHYHKLIYNVSKSV
ncbi:hypothetical protein [Lactobacillus agrestimuris]|uniref:Rgg family transcriptional regulator n=1 Tax=Lactobacillus agrestimuris TaxID=2941328 RepID=UPI002044A295|nr:hypothetical protein [Lactobacillus agrestimuris]